MIDNVYVQNVRVRGMALMDNVDQVSHIVSWVMGQQLPYCCSINYEEKTT